MRIRKYAKLQMLSSSSSHSSLQTSGAEHHQLTSPPLTTQAHVCQLNQSPWDVVPFCPSSFQFEFECGDSFNGNGSLGDSIGAVESVSSMMSIDAKSEPIEDMNDNNNYNRNHNNDDDDSKLSNLVEEGKRRGILKLKKHSSSSSGKSTKAFNKNDNVVDHEEDNNVWKKPEKSGRRSCSRAAKKGSSGNANEFYYYSGFGPRWGKRRGDRNEETSKDCSNVGKKTTSFGPIEEDDNAIGDLDFIEENDYDDDSDDNVEGGSAGGKKRMRRPVKARSLKSLM